MNTLPREIVDSFFETKQSFLLMKEKWRYNVKWKARLGPEHFLLYLALQGKDWRKAFQPICQRKQNCGRRSALNSALYEIHLDYTNSKRLAQMHLPEFILRLQAEQEAKLLRPFNGTVDSSQLARLRPLLPTAVFEFDQIAAYLIDVWD